jgi:hypothetical protein
LYGVTWALVSLFAAAGAHAQEDAPPEETPAEAPEEEAPEPLASGEVLRAQEHLDRAMQLLEAGDLDAALAELERGHELVGDHPLRHLITYNIAKAHEQRFRYDLALEHYHRYLAEAGPDAPERAAVEATMRTLEGLLATIVIEVNVPEAEVWVDDRQMGDAPGRVLVTGGRHVVEIRAEGYVEQRREVQLAAREEQALSFELVALAEEYRGISSTYFWGGVGLAAAGAIAGTVLGVLALSARSEVDSILEDPLRMYDGGLLEDKKRQIQNLALAADIGFGAAVLFATTSVILAFFTDWGGEAGSDTEGASAVRVTPAISADASGLIVGGSF